MPAPRIAGLFLLALAAPGEGSRFTGAKQQADDLLADSFRSGIWATEDCEYSEQLQEQGKGVGDTVKVIGADLVSVVECRDDEENLGKVCLMQGGCYDPSELAPVSTLQLTLHVMGGAAKQIWKAVSHDVTSAWKSVRLSLGEFGATVTARISQEASDLHDAVNFCKNREEGEMNEKEFNKTLVQSKSRFAMMLESAASRWQDAKEGIKSVVKATAAKLAKLAEILSEKFEKGKENLKQGYNTHLKPKLDALKKYFGGIADAVMDVPWREDGGDEESDEEDIEAAREAAQEPQNMENNVEGFTTKVAEFHAAVMELSREAYDSVVSVLARIQAGAGRMIAALSQRFVQVATLVKRMAVKAYEKVKEWTAKAVDYACNFSVKRAATNTFNFLKEKVKQAVDAVKHGARVVKETLTAMADNIAASLVLVSTKIRDTAKAVWESSAVQGAIAAIKEEIRVLKELIVQQASLVQKILGGFLSYFGRFIPRAIKDRLKTAGQKARELALKIRDEIAELMGKSAEGEADAATTETEVDEDSVAME